MAGPILSELPADAQALGQVERVYAAGRLYLILGWGTAIVSLLIGCGAPILYAVVPSPTPKTTGGLIAMVIVAAAFLLAGVGMFFWVRFQKRRQVVVFTNGLARRNYRGQWATLPWNAVKAFWDKGSRVRLESADGRQVKMWVVYLDDAREIKDHIEAKLSPYLLAPALAQFQGGSTVEIGPLAVNRRALRYKGKELPWDDVHQFQVNINNYGKYFRIVQKGKMLPFGVVNAGSVPNAWVLLQLVNEALQETPGQ